MGPGMKLPWLLIMRQLGIAPPDGKIQHYLWSACPKFKPICDPLTDQKTIYRKYRGQNDLLNYTTGDEINKIQMATNSAKGKQPNFFRK